MQTEEENSPNWIQIGDAYRNKAVSVRALAKNHGISDTAIRKRAKKENWVKFDANLTPREPTREPPSDPPPIPSEARRRAVATASVKELTDQGRNIILALMSELEFLNREAETLSEMVECFLNGEKDDNARVKLMKALNHETRCKCANQLATALAKLQDAAPGKKDQAKADAETAGQDGWDGLLDDEDAPPVSRRN